MPYTLFGLDKIHCIHLNDSKNPMGSHKDRHENIGLGTIGFDILYNIFVHEKLKDVPKILETPYIDREYPPFKQEIEALRQGKFHPNLVEEVKEYYK